MQEPRGTRVRFKPDPEIFGKGCAFRPARLFRMARSKAYLFGGVEIRWTCAPALLAGDSDTPESATVPFPRRPGRLPRPSRIEGQEPVTTDLFAGRIEKPSGPGAVEWAIAWIGGRRLHQLLLQHRADRRGRHARGGPARRADHAACKAYAELTGDKRAAQVTADDVLGTAAAMLSVFIRKPEFQGQTKERLSSAEAHAPRRERAARPLRPLADRQPERRPTACSTG